MAGANGITAHIFHDFQLPLHGAEIKRRTQRTQVVMQVDPF